MLAVDRKQRLAIPPQPVAKQPAAARIRNWREVYQGYDLESARVEATRCIQCPAAPCTKACPLHNDIPGALALLEAGDPIAAARHFRLTSPMPEICGRLCPQERLCEGSCVVGKKSKPVAIGRLEAFCADSELAEAGRAPAHRAASSARRVAVVGAGPAGLVVAEHLALRGHSVVVFDASAAAGGLLANGIPSFKLDKLRVGRLVLHLESLGVEFRLGERLSVDSLAALREEFDAVFLGHGASAGRELGVPGEALPGVRQATPFLSERPALEGRTLVIGGGDTAMDCARTAVRAGACEVVCVYRRSEAEMPGRAEERRNADEEGVAFEFLAAPIEMLPGPGGRVARVRFRRMALGEPDASGRARPVPVPGSEFELEAETVVVAAGYGVDPAPVRAFPGLELTAGGTIAAEAGMTGARGVFAAGDNVRGADLVVTALVAAKEAAERMDRFLDNLRGSQGWNGATRPPEGGPFDSRAPAQDALRWAARRRP